MANETPIVYASLVLVIEKSDNIIRVAIQRDVTLAKSNARIPVIGGYAYLARFYQDSTLNSWTEGLTDAEIAELVL